MTTKKAIKEEDHKNDGDEREKYSGNQRDDKKQYFRPKSDPRLRRAELSTSALGTDADATRIDMQFRAQFDIVTPAAKIAE